MLAALQQLQYIYELPYIGSVGMHSNTSVVIGRSHLQEKHSVRFDGNTKRHKMAVLRDHRITMAMHFTRRELFWDAQTAPHCAAGRTRVNFSRTFVGQLGLVYRETQYISCIRHTEQ